MPPKKSALKKGTRKPKAAKEKEVSPTVSEQEILDAVPKYLPAPRKRVEAVSNVYLIYVVLRTDPERPPKVVVRKSYETQFDAFAAFAREYRIWTSGDKKSGSGIFPSCHDDIQFQTSQLINQLGKSRSDNETAFKNTIPLEMNLGAKVEYSLVHRDDIGLDDNDRNKRMCIITCEQISHEAAA